MPWIEEKLFRACGCSRQQVEVVMMMVVVVGVAPVDGYLQPLGIPRVEAVMLAVPKPPGTSFLSIVILIWSAGPQRCRIAMQAAMNDRGFPVAGQLEVQLMWWHCWWSMWLCRQIQAGHPRHQALQSPVYTHWPCFSSSRPTTPCSQASSTPSPRTS